MVSAAAATAAVAAAGVVVIDIRRASQRYDAGRSFLAQLHERRAYFHVLHQHVHRATPTDWPARSVPDVHI